MTKPTVLQRAKNAVWHVRQTGHVYMVSRGADTLPTQFVSYHEALDCATRRNEEEQGSLDPLLTQSLIEQAEILQDIRRDSRMLAERYLDHPVFQKDDSSENIFDKMARIIDHEMSPAATATLYIGLIIEDGELTHCSLHTHVEHRRDKLIDVLIYNHNEVAPHVVMAAYRGDGAHPDDQLRAVAELYKGYGTVVHLSEHSLTITPEGHTYVAQS